MRKSMIFIVGFATLGSFAGIPAAEALKIKLRMECTCTCIAYDSGGNRHEGGQTTFTTPGSDCTIGINVGCDVGGLRGAYASCLGKDISAGLVPKGGTDGVLDPGPGSPPGRAITPGGGGTLQQ
jgi:hypothetical protein